MRKLIIVILSILLFSNLVGCNSDTTIEDYLSLEAEFRGVRDEEQVSYLSHLIIDLYAELDAVLFIVNAQVRQDGLDELKEMLIISDHDGKIVFHHDMILMDNRIFIELDFFMSELLHSIFNNEVASHMEGDISMDELSVEDVLGGGYAYVELTGDVRDDFIDRVFNDKDRAGLYGAFSRRTLENHLSISEEGGFRIEIKGEDVKPYIFAVVDELGLIDNQPILDSFSRVAYVDDRLLDELIDDFVGWLTSANLEEAILVIERDKVESDTFTQEITLKIPGYIAFAYQSTIEVGGGTPVRIPSHYIEFNEFLSRLDVWLLGMMLSEHTANEQDSDEFNFDDILEFLLEEDFDFDVLFSDGTGGLEDMVHIDEIRAYLDLLDGLETTISLDLIGEWAWVYNDDYTYYFRTDGTGRRGFSNQMENFEWMTTSDGQLFIQIGWRIEHWAYEIDNNSFTINSLQAPGITFSYTRN